MSQNDYIIDNAPGADFRADINAAFNALVSQSSGLTEPTTTSPYQVWADTTADILKIRNAADTGWVSVYTLSTGEPIAVTGTAVSFDNTASGLTATDAQAAIDEVEGRLDTVESDKAPLAAPTFTGQVTVSDFFGVADSGELTIATDAITVTGSRHIVDTEADAATDDLSTISGGVDGNILILSAADSTRDVVVKDGIGNISSAGDFTLDHVDDRIGLMYVGTTWVELFRSDNGV